MSNIGDELFTYDTFQQAYDSDPKIQNIVADFNKNSVKIKSGDENKLTRKPTSGKNTLAAMAKRATDLGDM
jgi:hypothetical protein